MVYYNVSIIFYSSSSSSCDKPTKAFSEISECGSVVKNRSKRQQ